MEKEKKITNPYLRAAAFIFLLLGSVVMLFPFFWMISGSLKTLREITSPAGKADGVDVLRNRKVV